jgi:hypothetical protein
MSFHAFVIDRQIVDRAAHGNDGDLAQRKHFTMLLVNKIQRRLREHPEAEQTFRIWVDPIPSRYKKADEVVQIIANNVLGNVFGVRRPVDKVITRDSKTTPSIQLCDVLLGAISGAWNQQSIRPEKQDLQKWIARFLGWYDLRSDTHVKERKLNIWYMHDSRQGPRDVETRPVDLIHPLPPRMAVRRGAARRAPRR